MKTYMSDFVQIPDGDNAPVKFKYSEIVAYRRVDADYTWIFLRGEEDGWKMKCPISEVEKILDNYSAYKEINRCQNS